MTITGGCYCGQIRYQAEGDPLASMQCHCRECQYITGGNANTIMAMPKSGFSFTKGEPKEFARPDLERPGTRLFCGNCGTGIGTRSPARPDAMIIKVGTMDDPSVFKAQFAIFMCDKQHFHLIPEDLPTFDKRPG
ncbi:MAG: GFA family protein [Alphaproteobacteria bacterium]